MYAYIMHTHTLILEASAKYRSISIFITENVYSITLISGHLLMRSEISSFTDVSRTCKCQQDKSVSKQHRAKHFPGWTASGKCSCDLLSLWQCLDEMALPLLITSLLPVGRCLSRPSGGEGVLMCVHKHSSTCRSRTALLFYQPQDNTQHLVG